MPEPQSTEAFASAPDSDQLPQPALAEAERESRRRAGPRLLALGAIIVVVLAIALVAGTLPKVAREREAEAAAVKAASAAPRVTVVTARLAPSESERVLPGNSLPFQDVALYPRITGYLNKWLVDIGMRVEEGQLLAIIDAPDVDDQLAQAQANLTQARANLPLAEANAELARTTLDRYIQAGPGTGVTLQQIDQQRATVQTTAAQVAVTRASIQVNEAAVQRFTDLQKFERITAPFRGVITARNVDPGALVTADSPNTTRELFHLMQTDVLRVFVNVPQVFATGIAAGQDAAVFRREEPQKQHPGKVTRTADALDPNTRTLLTQVEVPNPDNSLRPGMYLQVKFLFNRDVVHVRIPSAAVVVRTDGTKVAILDGAQSVHYRKVQLGRDYGAEVDVVMGLDSGDTVVVHPGDDLPEGTVVEPIPLPAR